MSWFLDVILANIAIASCPSIMPMGQSSEFSALADQRFAEIAATGKTIPWAEMRSYLEARLAGKKKPRRRAARKIAL